MSAQRIFIWILILFIVLVFRPAGVWRELKNLWRRREFITKVLFAIVGLYFLYGLYLLYNEASAGW